VKDNELWMALDALAADYGRVYGARPNRLHVGAAVAEQLEPNHGDHPLHLSWVSPTRGGVWFPARPMREASWLDQWRKQRACKRNGGHWWHPADPMIEWFCCRCGKDRDGTPQDGT
jgi:hypothetical protein